MAAGWTLGQGACTGKHMQVFIDYLLMVLLSLANVLLFVASTIPTLRDEPKPSLFIAA